MRRCVGDVDDDGQRFVSESSAAPAIGCWRDGFEWRPSFWFARAIRFVVIHGGVFRLRFACHGIGAGDLPERFVASFGVIGAVGEGIIIHSTRQNTLICRNIGKHEPRLIGLVARTLSWVSVVNTRIVPESDGEIGESANAESGVGDALFRFWNDRAPELLLDIFDFCFHRAGDVEIDDDVEF